MITHNVDELFFSVTDIYTQYDEGEINYAETVAILNRVCRHFLGENNEQE